MKTNLLNAFKDIFKEFLVDFTKFWQKAAKLLTVKLIKRIDHYRKIYLEHKGKYQILKYGEVSLKAPYTSGLSPENTGYNYFFYLTELTKHLPANNTMIDVGAYIGDTLADCVQHNPKLNYLSIEPASYLIDYLNFNADMLKTKYPDSKIVVKQALVGKKVKKAKMDKVVFASPEQSEDLSQPGELMHTETLDNIFADSGLNNLKLIKTDVQGYDYDAINSGMNIIKKYSPIIFFEYYPKVLKWYEGYIAMIKQLIKQDYKYWVILHTSSVFVTDTYNTRELFNLLKFRYDLSSLTSPPPESYYDLACCKKKDEAILKKALKVLK